MKRLWMRSLTGQWIALMLLALVASQVLFFLIYQVERGRSLREVRLEEYLARVAAIAQLLETSDPARHPEIMRAVGTGLTRYWTTNQPPVAPAAWQEIAREQLSRALSPGQATGGNPHLTDSDLRAKTAAEWTPLTDRLWSGTQPAQLLDLTAWNGFGVAVDLADGRWMHAVYAKPETFNDSAAYFYLSFGITAVMLSLVSVVAVRRIGRPMQHLAESADRLGRGEEVTPLPEEGAEDIQRTAAAFNRMQSRLRRFVEDRTRMLAAISHDLRTPITSLRLRAEFIDDIETKDKVIATLNEMQAMTEAVLTFAREESVVESTRSVDLAALLASLSDDLAEMGWQVDFQAGGRVPWRGRSDALRRALRNLIENAVRYGGCARLGLTESGDWWDITVDDDGPGISDEDLERVFTPFVRLEQSRNRSTGGVGLGLSIARTIARSQGGDITLQRRAGGGLRATLRLPQT